MYPMLTWGQWLTSSGFGGAAAVLAAVIAFVGVRRTSRVQRDNARKDQWWDRLKWAADLILSGDEDKANVGLSALDAIAKTPGFDADEQRFLRAVTQLFLLDDESGTLDSGTGYDENRGEETHGSGIA